MKKTIAKKEVNRLFDLEVDEVSLVDKPAIGESFIVTKSLKDQGDSSMGSKKMSVVKKTMSWDEQKRKEAPKEGDSCGFCKVKAEDAPLGLVCSVCFDCAVEREEKGVFSACIEGTFDMAKYKETHPDDEAFKGESVETEGEESSNENTEAEKTTEVEPSEEPNEEGSSSTEGEKSEDYDTRLAKVEKGMGDISSMLSQSLELHGVAADALNQVMSLTFGALDLLMVKLSGEESEKVESLKSDLKIAHEDVSKAGAKISSGRLAVLRDIAEKLSSLIEAVSLNQAKESEKGTQVTVSEKLETLKSEIDDLKKSILDSVEGVEGKLSEKFKGIDNRIEELEGLGVGTSAVGDDADAETPRETKKSDSIFGSILGLDEIEKSARHRR